MYKNLYHTPVTTKLYYSLCTATNRSHVDLVIQIDTIHSFLLQYLQLQVSFSETYITHNNEKAITSNIIISDIKYLTFFNAKNF